MPTFIDYTGKRIGRVNILHQVKSNSIGSTRWECKCDCGNFFDCLSRSFKRGETFECDKCRFERRRGIDLTGKKYGRWTVINRTFDKNNKTLWHCKCDCGKEGLVSTYCLGREHKSLSCGCWGRKKASKWINDTIYPPSHNLSRHDFYKVKTPLIHKCYKKTHPSYEKFGGIGITVCDVWKNGVRDMYEWAIENGWTKGDIIVLKEGKKQFNPENCIILNDGYFRSEVSKKSGYQISYEGQTHSVSRWAKILNVDSFSLRRKLNKIPSIEEVFKSEFRKCKFVRGSGLKIKALELYKSGKRLCEIAKDLGSSRENIKYHLITQGVEVKKEIPIFNRSSLNDEEIKKYLDMGLCKNQIAKKLGVSFTSITNRINNMNGIKRKRKKIIKSSMVN